MKSKYPYLDDPSFLREIDTSTNKEQWARLTVLTMKEKPIQEIQGVVTGGNINVDGTSSMRRTCNISLVASSRENDLTNVNNLISINKKVRLEIGFTNRTDKYKEHDVIWFPQGVYVINAPYITHGLDGVDISVQLKDKMCLLNGENGGTFHSAVTFHEFENLNSKGKMEIGRPTLYRILVELMNHYGGEPLEKIIISDVDERIRAVIRWTGKNPIFIKETLAPDGSKQFSYTLDEKQVNGHKKYVYGEEIGYVYDDFTSPDELIADVGDSVTDILDKIRDMLGNYEYFYDVYGNFVFQEIKNYLNTSKAKYEIDRLKDEDYIVQMGLGKTVYDLDNSLLVNSYSVAPQYHLIKNDFVVWGAKRDPVTKIETPIRYHLAIDNKPEVGNKYTGFFYEHPDTKILQFGVPQFYLAMTQLPKVGNAELFYYVAETTSIYKWNVEKQEYEKTSHKIENITTKDWRSELYLSGCEALRLGLDRNPYHMELATDWTQIYDLRKGDWKENVKASPLELNYYLDFIDTTSPISELSIENIGRRTRAVVDKTVNCIFEPAIPDLVFLNNKNTEELARLRKECQDRGQNYIQVEDSVFKSTERGGKYNSAYNLIKTLLYQHTSYNESVSLTMIPIYHLEPNTLVGITDTVSGIKGNFVINSLSLPLDNNGTMSVSCVRALERE